jgi:hypothetical protein
LPGALQLPAYSLASSRPDGENDPLVAAKKRQKIEDLFPGKVFPVEKPHAVGGLLAGDDLRARINPLARDPPTRVAGGDPCRTVIADSFRLASACGRVHIDFQVGGANGKPDGRLYALAALAIGLEVQIFVGLELTKPRFSLHGRDSIGDITALVAKVADEAQLRLRCTNSCRRAQRFWAISSALAAIAQSRK